MLNPSFGMALKSLYSNRFFILSLILISLSLIVLFKFVELECNMGKIVLNQPGEVFRYPMWFDLIQEEIGDALKSKKIKVGLVNFNDDLKSEYKMQGLVATTIHVHFDHVSTSLTWEDFFPEWIDEDYRNSTLQLSPPTCPEIPMPQLGEYRDLDVVVAKVPCKGWTSMAGLRDVFRLQVNLVVANLLVRSGWITPDVKRPVYSVFIGDCGPMPEIFRSNDLVRKVRDHWVYEPELRRLKQKVFMPLGSCQIAQPDYERVKKMKYNQFYPKEAYVTVLHSSEAYVCGAIALAQSIIQSNSTRDLFLLYDANISPKSLTGLRFAGWKTLEIQPIRSPFAKKGSYNEWNYSKLRLWLLTWYHKVVFIDSDVLVLKNLDWLFVYPQLSAASNDKTLFNSGVMVIEPSLQMFEDLMVNIFKIKSYNGGDQGFLNEMFTWWHRLPSKVNFLKIFEGNYTQSSSRRENIPDDVYAIHYLGLKPWMCYRDYDCNWDMKDRQIFASDKAHEKWWQVYDKMPERLQQYCGLTEHMDNRIKKWRGIARNLSFRHEHWKIHVSDPRQYNLVQ